MSAPLIAPIADPSPWITPLSRHFGFDPQALAGYAFYQHGNSYLAICTADHRPPEELTSQGTGLRFLRLAMKVPRLTNAGARILAPLATEQLLRLRETQLDGYLGGEKRIECAGDQLASPSRGGQVIVCDARGLSLGVGHLHLGEGSMALESFYPRRWIARSLADTFRLGRERDRRRE